MRRRWPWSAGQRCDRGAPRPAEIGAESLLRRLHRQQTKVTRLEPIIGARVIPLGVEHLQVIYIADAQAELSGALVEVDGVLLGLVETAEVNGELAIDEHPDVVVAAEREDLTALITKGDEGFAGKV